MQPIDRRDFILGSAGLLAALATSGTAKAARNDVLRVGVAGIRGRGVSHIQGFENLPNAEVVALCDVDSGVLKARSDQLDQSTGRKVKRLTDVRKMIEDRDIDIISTATPNHWHALIGVWAMQAGKDVYVEKPCSHNVLEGRRLVEAARKYQRICQHGTQSRSSQTTCSAIEFIRAGGIGKVHTAKGLCYKWRPSIGSATGAQPVPKEVDYDLWLGPAAQQSLRRQRLHYDWHWFWDFGNGDIGNQGVHQMDIARWGLGKDSLPTAVSSVGGRYGYTDDGETPNTLLARFDYGDCQLVFEVRGLGTNAELGVKVGNIWYGSEGYLALGTPDGWNSFLGRKDEPGPSAKTYQPKERLATEDHFANFVQAVVTRQREQQTAEVEEGHLSSALGHLANIAYRCGRALTFDPKTETFTNDPQANGFLTRQYRSPFVVPDKV